MAGWERTYRFPKTKVYAPRLNSNILPRAHLLNRLYEAVTGYRLTLLSAAAGSGKTTALAALSEAYPELPLAWLALDEEDNEPGNFLTAFLAALQQLYPSCGSTAQTLLTSLPHLGAEIRRVMGVLINDILEDEPPPFVLVLDDLHFITDPAIFLALDYLLEHLPPPMHLVITSRQDPPLALSRLRARGQLAELRMADLSLTAEEVADLFDKLLQFTLTVEELNLLQQRLEGWVAGVRLLSLSLSRMDSAAERTDLIHHFVHSRRFIFDYLIDEVLQQQEPPIREFLLKTSILNELTPPLCAAVTGREDAALILEELYRRNLFLTLNELPATVPAEPSYRYHALFVQFLRRQLEREMADQIPQLHRRAAEAQTTPSRAIHHYLAAQMWPEAADLVEEIGRPQVEHEFIQPQLVRFIEALPEAVRAERPWLSLILGADAMRQGLFQAARPHFESALARFKAADDIRGQINTQLIASRGRQTSSNYEEMIAEIQRNITAHPDLVNPVQRIKFHLALAWRAVYPHQWDKVEENALAFLNLTLKANDPNAFYLIAQHIGPQFFFCDSGMEPFLQYELEVLKRFGQEDGLPQLGAFTRLGLIHFYQGNLAAARQAVAQAQRLSHLLGGFAYVDLLIDHVVLFDLLAQADYDALHAHLDNIWPRLEGVDTYRDYLAAYLFVRGRALCLQHRLEEAQGIQQQLEKEFSSLHQTENAVRSAILSGLVAIGQQNYTAAEDHLRRGVTLEQQTRHTLLAGRVRLTLAYLYWIWQRPQDALRELNLTLIELKQRGMPGIVLQEGRAIIPLLELAVKQKVQADFARQLLALFAGLPATSPQEKGNGKPQPDTARNDLLSEREREVLNLIAAGFTNREIAQQLFIAPSTVKRHTINMYNKLGVNNRTQAVTKARQLNLL